ncbi:MULTISPECIES: N-acetylglucosamine kinase [Bacteria]|uniref:N-acetylglucosamine kinase n=1 Tax=Bacteria TaxID=2 RepID=UPI003C7B1393
MHVSATVAVDLGKSRCRLAVEGDGPRIFRDGPGTPGLAVDGGVEQAVAAIRGLLQEALVALSDAPSLRVGVGAAGALADPDASALLAAILADAVGAPVAVASDVVTAHAGALRGGPGVLLIAGTGAVGFGVDEHGARQADGWGPELGDLGSGSWLGREAARAVLRARDGLGPETALAAAFADHLGAADSPITWLAGDTPIARRLATAAPLVLDLADAGDPVSVAIRDEGVRLLAATARAATTHLAADGDRTPSAAVALHGGLLDHSGYRAAVSEALAAHDLDVRPSSGDALTGAAMIAENRAPLHERFVHRAG